jgi:hypothetical protein
MASIPCRTVLQKDETDIPAQTLYALLSLPLLAAFLLKHCMIASSSPINMAEANQLAY